MQSFCKSFCLISHSAEVIMNGMRWLVRYGAVLALLVLGGCGRSPESTSSGEEDGSPPEQASVVVANADVLGVPFRVSGPYAHANLTIFLIHAPDQDKRNFLTLEEGLKGDLVSITEMDQEQVGELQIDNQSDRPLYLQEGERLSGGKQDRIIAASMVLPPKSGKKAVPTFCIEQSRWQEGDYGRKFGFTLNTALAPKGVRGAAKFEHSQGGVWHTVSVQKSYAKDKALAGNTNSSGNELLDAPRVRQLSDEYTAKLAAALRDSPDAVGVAVVLNNQIEEVNVYPNRALFGKLYPRLVGSYALQAEMLKGRAKAARVPLAADVERFMRAGAERARHDKTINTANTARVRELEGHKFQCATSYQGKTVHWQLMKKNGLSGVDRRRGGILGSDW
jgi:ARG/rhodanese/phosphatase superfamily protein